MAAGICGHPSRLAEDGEHLRMTVVLVFPPAKNMCIPQRLRRDDEK
jgi:hypothetical protein